MNEEVKRLIRQRIYEITRNEWSEEARQAAVEARRRRRAGTAVGATLGATVGLIGAGALATKGPAGIARGIGAGAKFVGRKLFGTAAKAASMTGRGVQAAAPATKGLLGSGGAKETVKTAAGAISGGAKRVKDAVVGGVRTRIAKHNFKGLLKRGVGGGKAHRGPAQVAAKSVSSKGLSFKDMLKKPRHST